MYLQFAFQREKKKLGAAVRPARLLSCSACSACIRLRIHMRPAPLARLVLVLSACSATVCTRCRTTNQFSEQECTADCVRRVDALLTPVFHWTDEGVNSTISHVVVENSRSWVVLDANRDSGKFGSSRCRTRLHLVGFGRSWAFSVSQIH